MTPFVLQAAEEVNAGAIDAAGWIVGLAGIAMVVAWLVYLYR